MGRTAMSCPLILSYMMNIKREVLIQLLLNSKINTERLSEVLSEMDFEVLAYLLGVTERPDKGANKVEDGKVLHILGLNFKKCEVDYQYEDTRTLWFKSEEDIELYAEGKHVSCCSYENSTYVVKRELPTMITNSKSFHEWNELPYAR